MNQKVSIDHRLKDILSEAVASIKADYAEIRVESEESTGISFRGHEPEVITQPSSLGFFVRVLLNGSWGVATFADSTKLKEKVAQALEFARLQGKGSVELAEVSKCQATVAEPLKKDFRQVSLRQKVRLVEHYNQLLFTSVPGIKSSFIGYKDSCLSKYFVNSAGAAIFQSRPYVRLFIQGIAEHGGIIETCKRSCGHVGGFEIVEGFDDKVVKVAREAAELSRVPKVKSGTYTVILDPFMAGTFAHEAFGHLSEADHQYESPKLLEQMQLGKKIGSDKVTIIDDPGLPSGWGNFTYDDEGVLAEKVNLITEGVISGRLHSLETAGKLKEKPNGRARADGFSSRPLIRMSNTFFKPGDNKLEDLVSSTKKGILLVDWLAGMTAVENFTFTAMYGVMIENGKLAGKVRGVKLLGNVFETLKNIDAVTSDFSHDQGMCGKLGQRMPVGSGGGYVRIHNVTVGGQ